MTEGSRFDRDPAAPLGYVRPSELYVAPGVGAAVVGVLGRLEDALEGSTVCSACGCLCLPGEVCPACRAARGAS